MRLNTFVGEKANAVNYHIIFSDSLSAQIIEENFLHRLTFAKAQEAVPALEVI